MQEACPQRGGKGTDASGAVLEEVIEQLEKKMGCWESRRGGCANQKWR